ncbi:hypothetical protein [Cellulomonas sp. S1-8]|uniref:hypothetical protein n=1 Tax=Cellulomonas sp. S1-8 TaxID=2904790 RepID=UPI00224465A6|nr:hypothetical protein [Cellulomonas sp. S1-8]UZN03842.1 hypothetical protein OKX07_02555 [Cellulomonas sp. S1-8]
MGVEDEPVGGRPAVIEVRVLPWRPRGRVMNHGIDLSPLSDMADDLIGGVVALVVGILSVLLLLVVLVGVVVVVLELWLVGVVALLLVLARFAGVLPWVVDTGRGTYERYRWLPNAARRVRTLNGTRHAQLRWHWS